MAGTKQSDVSSPDTTRFKVDILASGLREPMELAVGKEGIFWVERKGNLYYYDFTSKQPFLISSFKLFTGINDGLLGITLDPEYESNNFIYLYYSPEGSISKQHLSRFLFDEKSKVLTEEKVILEIPTQRKECCHSSGTLAFGPDRNLFIGVGDNVSPKVQEGYSPLDERPGREAFDAQGTSANSNDLRGKILRIRIETDGSYTIPDGNLFPKDGSNGKPEIYAMGTRNPFRISIDPKTGFLYFGDIGPDANVSSDRGPEAFDEVNVAKKPGNYGWPYFVADNKPYPKYNFETGEIGAVQDPKNPNNNSPHNTGIKNLHPVEKPMIWYGFETNPLFPELGKGGRSIMAGPIYRFNPDLESSEKLPEYYDNTLFIYDWMRDWIKVVKLDDRGDYKSIEDFRVGTKFNSPMDMQIGADGALYVLEYGKGWYNDNPDARLVKISYISGNRSPMSKASVSTDNGSIPLKVQFLSKGSYDPDKNPITYEWYLLNNDELTSTDPNPAFTYKSPGIYKAKLVVKDNEGKSAQSEVEVVAGNTKPEVTIEFDGNTTFFPRGGKLNYKVNVKDKEDGSLEDGKIKKEDLKILFGYSASKENLSPMLTETTDETPLPVTKVNHPGRILIDQSDCKSCHMSDRNSIGPSYKEIATRYKEDKEVLNKLSSKIINGGGGEWNRDFVMISHPSLSRKAAEEMIKYILTFAEEKPTSKVLEPIGTIAFGEVENQDGLFQFRAKYTDRGGENVKPLSASFVQTWISPLVQAEGFHEIKGLKIIGNAEEGYKRYLGEANADAYIGLKKIDCTNLSSLDLKYSSVVAGTKIEVRIDSVNGKRLGFSSFSSTDSSRDWREKSMNLEQVDGKHDLYIIFLNPDQDQNLIKVDWVNFNIKQN